MGNFMWNIAVRTKIGSLMTVQVWEVKILKHKGKGGRVWGREEKKVAPLLKSVMWRSLGTTKKDKTELGNGGPHH